jgi:hypothetical protein
MAEQVGPIKLFEFLRPPDGAAEPDLYGRWAHERREWLGQRPELARHLRRHDLYERVPVGVVDEGSDVVMPDTGFVAVSVQWFDSLAEYDALRSDPAAAALRELDDRFRSATVATVLTGPPNVITGPPGGDPSSGCSLICILHRAPALDLTTFHDHWLHHHGGLFQNVPELRDPLLGYEQNHGLELADADYDGVTQQWFTSVETWSDSVAVPAHADVVSPDVAYFLDPERLHFIIAGPPTTILG